MILFLIVANMVAFLMHFIAEIFFLDMQGEYSGFLLVENFLITLIFAKMAFLLKKRREKYLIENVIFWGFFLVAVVIFRPSNTTLEIMSGILPMEQWIVLMIGGIVVIFVNIFALVIYKKRG